MIDGSRPGKRRLISSQRVVLSISTPWRSLRCGVYLRVLEEGDVSAGDTVDVAQSAGVRINIRALFAAYLTPNERDSQDVLAAALTVPGLSAKWHAQISERLARRGHPSAD